MIFMDQTMFHVFNNKKYDDSVNLTIYIYISLFTHTSYKAVHRKCNCIQTEYIKI